MKELHVSCNLYEARSKIIRSYRKDEIASQVARESFKFKPKYTFCLPTKTGSANTVDTTFGQVPSGSHLSYQFVSFNERNFSVVCSIPTTKQQVGSFVALASPVYTDFPLRKQVLLSYPVRKHLCSLDEQLLLDSTTVSNNNANKIEKETQM